MSSSRDVMCHAAVTIVPRKNGLTIIGEKDQEVCQFAFELMARKLPWPERILREALNEQANMVLEKMRSAGMVKP